MSPVLRGLSLRPRARRAFVYTSVPVASHGNTNPASIRTFIVKLNRTFARAGTDSPEASHSHSMVAGGFDVMSYTTRLMPGTSLTMRVEMAARTSQEMRAKSAVMPSCECTARTASV